MLECLQSHWGIAVIESEHRNYTCFVVKPRCLLECRIHRELSNRHVLLQTGFLTRVVVWLRLIAKYSPENTSLFTRIVLLATWTLIVWPKLIAVRVLTLPTGTFAVNWVKDYMECGLLHINSLGFNSTSIMKNSIMKNSRLFYRLPKIHHKASNMEVILVFLHECLSLA